MIKAVAFTLSVLLAQSASCQDAQYEQAQAQLDSARRLLVALQTTDKQRKEITPGCVATPIATTPIGPTSTFEVATAASGQRVRGVLWRQPCGGGDAQFIVTLQPVAGTPFVCGRDIELTLGAQRTDDIFLDVNPNDGVASSFCANLTQTTSFVLNEFDASFPWDDDAAFGFVYESDFGPDATVAVAVYDPAAYPGGGSTATAINGRLSGSYFAASRNGEGVMVEVGRVGARRVLFLAWFTYFQGQQRYFVGSIDLAAGATSAVVPLVLTSGGQFGSAFDPALVTFTPWGSATVDFPSCTSMRFSWAETGGASGSYNYLRSLDGLDGVSCP